MGTSHLFTHSADPGHLGSVMPRPIVPTMNNTAMNLYSYLNRDTFSILLLGAEFLGGHMGNISLI